MPTGSSSGDAPTVGLRERKKTIAKQALRRAAFDLFTTQGFEATTVEDIARRADVSRASFFRYFTAKEDVLAADDAERREAFFDLLDKENKPLLAGLHAAVSAYLAGMDAEALAHAAAYTRIMVSSRVVLGQAYENRIRWLSELETHVRGRLAGAADLDVVAPLVADLTLGVLETAFRLAAVSPGTPFETVVDRGFRMLGAVDS
ncbi:TetR/AcrR family transcriptional regulator [Amycolatopsis sp. NBC_01286]|uniref:TetR/AcrR family transcriptional regulator n=1 Tax=Amycolatopsis sp. NBC_01286 TaxID=2903560 RepID=UPI002E0FE2EB|nr:TetR/AcrR family transcriptional regulator [Amycolatopsis sp. NBC_01286]